HDAVWDRPARDERGVHSDRHTILLPLSGRLVWIVAPGLGTGPHITPAAQAAGTPRSARSPATVMAGASPGPVPAPAGRVPPPPRRARRHRSATRSPTLR